MTGAPSQPGAVPEHPALAPWCRVVDDGRRVLVEHGGTVVTLEGRAASALLPRLLPLLDGTRTEGEIVDALGAAARPAVAKALSLLARHRLLVEGRHVTAGDEGVAAAATFAAYVTGRATQATAIERLESARVAVLGSGAGARELRRLLRRSGVRAESLPLDDPPADTSLLVVVPGPNELAALAEVNEVAFARRLPWLQLLPYDGRFVVAGPIFLPGESACRACWVTRRAACSGYEEDFALVEGEAAKAPSMPAVVALGASLAALLAVRWLATGDPTLPGRYYALETRTVLDLRFDRVLRVPRCRVCGPAPQAVPSPWFEVAR